MIIKLLPTGTLRKGGYILLHRRVHKAHITYVRHRGKH